MRATVVPACIGVRVRRVVRGRQAALSACVCVVRGRQSRLSVWVCLVRGQSRLSAAEEHVRRKIGDRLLKAGLISDRDLRAALSEQERTGERLGAVLVRLELVSERQVARTLAQQLGLAYVNLAAHPPDPAALVLIPRELASKRVSIAVRFEDDTLVVATADPLLLESREDVETTVGSPVRPAVATRTDILRAIQTGYAARPIPAPIAAETTCRRCGGPLRTGWRFCPFCASSTAAPRWPVSSAADRDLKPAAGGFR